MRLVLTIAIMTFWLEAFSLAQSETQVKYWNVTVATKSLTEISNILSDPTTPRWPIIISSYAVDRLPDNQKQIAINGIELACALQKKITDHFDSVSELSLTQLETEVALYNSIATALNQAGGYGNLVLADSSLRLAIFRISGWLVFHPDDTSETEKLLQSLNVPTINVKNMFTELAQQDAEVQSHESEIQKIKNGDNLFKACESIGIKPDVVFVPSSKFMSSFLRESSVVGLIARRAETEAIVKVNLAGAVRFFQLGGTYSELDPRDIRPFESRMKNEAKAYKYPILQIKQFKASDVLYLIAIHKDLGIKSAWLDSALK